MVKKSYVVVLKCALLENQVKTSRRTNDEDQIESSQANNVSQDNKDAENQTHKYLPLQANGRDLQHFRFLVF